MVDVHGHTGRWTRRSGGDHVEGANCTAPEWQWLWLRRLRRAQGEGEPSEDGGATRRGAKAGGSSSRQGTREGSQSGRNGSAQGATRRSSCRDVFAVLPVQEGHAKRSTLWLYQVRQLAVQHVHWRRRWKASPGAQRQDLDVPELCFVVDCVGASKRLNTGAAPTRA